MNTSLNCKIDQLEYLMQELDELRLHMQDLRDEHELLMHDNRTIRHATDVRKLILTRDYFDVDDMGINSEFMKAACKKVLQSTLRVKYSNKQKDC